MLLKMLKYIQLLIEISAISMLFNYV